ncbi:hypothetical protein [Hymenobacter pini]|uniref:hypothetical protein n=1 Tax=Hymenobacter pini TaxID=2880879 RepID=UPI001CF56693|nr:hypothetical protein [Hymenobacter pini]MCA8829713.1 hypothetical protein [Hymenobacter pini]
MEHIPEDLKRRSTLKQYFKQGTMPTEESFAHLIDSSVNRLDDGFYKHPQLGLQMGAAEGRPNAGIGLRLMAFYRNLQQLQNQCATWVMSLLATAPEGDTALGLGFSEPQGRREDHNSSPAEAPPVRLFLAPGGAVGVGTTQPTEQLSVTGFVGSVGRVGTFQHEPAGTTAAPNTGHPQPAAVQVPADGEWHPIITGLQGLWAFEIVAAAYGPHRSGTYAMAHAIALGVHGQRQRIVPHRASYRGWRQQLQFCWQIERPATAEEPVPVYGLRMRTRKSFGPDAAIVYHITCLFNNCSPQGW